MSWWEMRGLLWGMREAFQVLSDCPRCRVESAVVELVDPSIVEGIAVESHCRLCGYATSMGQITSEGVRFREEAQARAALFAWAEAEGEGDLEVFCVANLGGLCVEAACQRLLAGQRITTSFDVVAFLFPGLGGGGEVMASPETEMVTLKPSPSMIRERALRG